MLSSNPMEPTASVVRVLCALACVLSVGCGATVRDSARDTTQGTTHDTALVRLPVPPHVSERTYWPRADGHVYHPEALVGQLVLFKPDAAGACTVVDPTTVTTHGFLTHPPEVKITSEVVYDAKYRGGDDSIVEALPIGLDSDADALHEVILTDVQHATALTETVKADAVRTEAMAPLPAGFCGRAFIDGEVLTSLVQKSFRTIEGEPLDDVALLQWQGAHYLESAAVDAEPRVSFTSHFITRSEGAVGPVVDVGKLDDEGLQAALTNPDHTNREARRRWEWSHAAHATTDSRADGTAHAASGEEVCGSGI